MKKIIVPVDFTIVSMNALKYAIKAFPNAEIQIIHTVQPSMNTTEVKYSFLNKIELEEDKLFKELKQIILLELDLSVLPNNYHIHICKGDIAEQILQYAKNNPSDALVMGTRDKYDFIEKAIGTVSLAVVKKLEIPVYLIPKGACFDSFRKVIVATDSNIKKNNLAETIHNWNSKYNAFVKFVHVSIDDTKFIKETDDLVEGLFKNEEPKFGFELKKVIGNNISKLLLQEATDFSADLLITIPEKQNFLSTLFFKSISKKLIQKSKTPLLFLKPIKFS